MQNKYLRAVLGLEAQHIVMLKSWVWDLNKWAAFRRQVANVYTFTSNQEVKAVSMWVKMVTDIYPDKDIQELARKAPFSEDEERLIIMLGKALFKEQAHIQLMIPFEQRTRALLSEEGGKVEVYDTTPEPRYTLAEPEEVEEVQLEHNLPYYYDDARDVYVVHLPSKTRPLALQGSLWRQIREAYSNWDDAPSSINEICRKFSMSRQTVVDLLKCMGVTHSSSPWADEHMVQADEDELVQDLLRRKEEKVYVKAQRKSWNKVKKDAEKYRSFEHFAMHIRTYFEEMDATGAGDVPKLSLPQAAEQFSLVISPTDFHWGKRGVNQRGESYNREIARERLLSTTTQVLSAVSHRGRPEIIYLALGGDGLHIDNQNSTTTRGTPQDCDGTPSEIAGSYISLLVEYINLVRQFGAHVHVFCVAGNHDYYSTTLVRCAIQGWFQHASDVSVEQDLSPRQHVLYGKSLLTFMHGDDGPTRNYPSIIAAEKPAMWGKSKWRFIFTGHFHTERELPNFGDITVYRMPSLAGSDDYHARKGYRSRKAIIGYVVSKTRGVIATEIAPVI